MVESRQCYFLTNPHFPKWPGSALSIYTEPTRPSGKHVLAHTAPDRGGFGLACSFLHNTHSLLPLLHWNAKSPCCPVQSSPNSHCHSNTWRICVVLAIVERWGESANRVWFRSISNQKYHNREMSHPKKSLGFLAAGVSFWLPAWL